MYKERVPNNLRVESLDPLESVVSPTDRLDWLAGWGQVMSFTSQ